MYRLPTTKQINQRRGKGEMHDDQIEISVPKLERL